MTTKVNLTYLYHLSMKDIRDIVCNIIVVYSLVNASVNN